MPADLVSAIEHANRVLDWQENLSGEEMPPEWMWPLDEEIIIWMDRISDERREKYGLDRDDDGRDTAVPLMQNQYAREMG